MNKEERINDIQNIIKRIPNNGFHNHEHERDNAYQKRIYKSYNPYINWVNGKHRPTIGEKNEGVSGSNNKIPTEGGMAR